MQNCDTVSTPADSNSRLSASQNTSDSLLKFHYRNAVGALIHLCVTRPNLNFAVDHVAKHSSNPEKSHINAAKRILAYVKGTANYGICFGNNNTLVAFCDADYAGDTEHAGLLLVMLSC